MTTYPVLLAMSEEERDVLIDALTDYAEWSDDGASDKRQEAGHSITTDAEGLSAEADYIERQGVLALRLIERVRTSQEASR